MSLRSIIARLGFAVWLACWSPPGNAADAVIAYAEEFPPYNFSRDGEVAGISTDMLRQICDEAKIVCKIEIVPWARAYRIALTRANTIVFSTARTIEREGKFLWVGPIRMRRMFLYVPASSSLTAENIAEAKGLRIGVVNGDSASFELKDAELRQPVLDTAPSVESNLHKLFAGRIDAMPATELGMAASLQLLGRDGQSVRTVLSYPASDLYYAVNRDTDPGIVEALNKAWGALNTPSWRSRLAAPYVEMYGLDPQVDR